MVKDLLFELKNEGTTIFFNTHILSDVESVCDKISIIHK
jgi:ABC-2 type transport system ATP-binding protein